MVWEYIGICGASALKKKVKVRAKKKNAHIDEIVILTERKKKNHLQIQSL